MRSTNQSTQQVLCKYTKGAYIIQGFRSIIPVRLLIIILKFFSIKLCHSAPLIVFIPLITLLPFMVFTPFYGIYPLL